MYAACEGPPDGRAAGLAGHHVQPRLDDVQPRGHHDLRLRRSTYNHVGNSTFNTPDDRTTTLLQLGRSDPAGVQIGGHDSNVNEARAWSKYVRIADVPAPTLVVERAPPNLQIPQQLLGPEPRAVALQQIGLIHQVHARFLRATRQAREASDLLVQRRGQPFSDPVHTPRLAVLLVEEVR